MPKNDRRADFLVGKARIFGMTVSDLAGRSGIKQATFYRRLKNPGSFTLAELEEITRVLRLTDAELLYLLNGKGGL